MNGRLHHTSFRAMGTTCTVSVTARDTDRLRARHALVAASAEVEACERALSRFDPASDLSRLNAASGEWVEIDRRLERALRAATPPPRGDRRQVRPDDPARPRRRRLRPQLRAAHRAPRPHRRRLAGRRRDRTHPRPRPDRAWCCRRPRRHRQGLLGLLRARGDVRRLAGDARRDRRSRRRHRRLGLSPGPRAVADRDRRSPQRRRDARRAPARARRRRDLRPQRTALRPLGLPPPSDRPGHRRSSLTRAARRDRGRARSRPRPRDMRPHSASRASRRP